MIKLKLYRDKVISIVNGKDLVGLYIKQPCFCDNGDCECGSGREILLGEFSPTKADNIIKTYNTK